MDRRVHPRLSYSAICVGLLIVVTAVLYTPSLSGGFVYEDRNDPEAFFKVQPVGTMLLNAIQKPARSLTVWSYRLSGVISPLDPFGYRLVNLGLHLLNVWLLWLVARRVLVAGGAVLAAGFFALHPVQTESVAYISSRADLLGVTCVLLGLWCVERKYWWGAVAACAAAFLAKETFVVAVALVPLWALWRGRWAESLELGLLWLVVPMTGWGLWMYGGLLSLSDMGRVLAQWVRLLALWFVPWGLTIDHDWARIPTGVAWLALVVTVVAVAFVVLGWLVVEEQPPVAVLAVLWAVIIVAPRLVVPLAEGLHEHHLYLMTPILSLCAGAWMTTPWRTENLTT